jgi:hypothetical protein
MRVRAQPPLPEGSNQTQQLHSWKGTAMSETAFQTMYRQEYIATFEQTTTDLRPACIQQAVIRANTATFLVAGSGGATAVTRGINGMIPYGVIDNTQLSCTLVEKHAPFETTEFNIFASQGDQRSIMQKSSIATLARDIDDTIVTQLDTATQDTGTAVEGNQDLIEKCLAVLGNNDVPVEEEDKMFGLITPAMRAFLRQTTSYTSGEYVDVKPLNGPVKKMWRWAGVNWITSSRLTGKGTSAEYCYILHQNSIGHAANSKEMKVKVGFDEKQDNSWTRASLYHAALLLQNSGVMRMVHDGSRYVAS